MDAVADNFGLFLEGFRNTIALVLITGTVALVIGVVASAMRMSPIGSLRFFGGLYVTLFRNTPSVVLMFVAVFLLPQLDLNFSFFVSAVIALSLYYGSYFCETVRSGIEGVPYGQIEAARSVGLTFPQSMRTVVLPQALRSMVPALINVEIGVIRTSAIAGAFGVLELFAATKLVAAARGDAVLWALLMATVLYLSLTLMAGAIARRVERRVAFDR
ncbi:amino acid ABC transporter permease [Mycobacterium sp. NAZ190054]|uniref:amino acid ABC transporter permease n=1 Tax=Mycobacterium sp. NAZ190054 TaxID=1747766 RepID=UPI0007918F1C|nr:amino acid ABC transporter permease [Mycobacterium sp. NAZ190054]KWX67791.1 hypothetical protein ASJ79_20470 [Mycobacterium sp. NAZ190054]